MPKDGKGNMPVESSESSSESSPSNADRKSPEEPPTPVPKTSHKAEAEPPSEPNLETRVRALRLSLNKVTKEKCRLSKELALKEEEDNLLSLLAKERSALENLQGQVSQPAASEERRNQKAPEKPVIVFVKAKKRGEAKSLVAEEPFPIFHRKWGSKGEVSRQAPKPCTCFTQELHARQDMAR